MDKYSILFFDYLAGCGLKPKTIKRMKCIIKRFYEWLNTRDIRDIKETDIIELVKYLYSIKSQYGRLWSPRSIECFLSCIKSYFNYLFNNEYILASPVENMKIKQHGDKRLKKIFTTSQINELLDSISIEDEDSQRDRSFLELMYSSGLRVNELFNLELENINFESRTILVKQGKGNKDRYVPFSEIALKFIVKYVNDGRKKILKKIKDNESKKYLFLTFKGRISHKCMSKRFKRYLEKAGLNNKDFTLYSIRHTTATHLLEAGASIRYVQELLGHECINTTQIYARPSVENIKRIYKTFHPRENEYYEEVTEEYLKELESLKERIIEERQEIARWGRKAKLK